MPGYHCLIEELEKKLTEALSSDLIQDKNEARLFIGRNCLPDMREFAARHGVKLLPTDNCLSAMVGKEKLIELEKDKTMVLTPAWIRKMFLHPEGIPAFLNWDETDFRVNFGRYDRFLILETSELPTDLELLECFELFGGNGVIETIPCPPDYFNNLVSEFLA
jgi:hypothetical protein